MFYRVGVAYVRQRKVKADKSWTRLSLFHPRGEHQKPDPRSMFCSTKATTADGSLVAKPCSLPAGVTNITRQSLPALLLVHAIFLWKP
jgi:hypothetical protein